MQLTIQNFHKFLRTHVRGHKPKQTQAPTVMRITNRKPTPYLLKIPSPKNTEQLTATFTPREIEIEQPLQVPTTSSQLQTPGSITYHRKLYAIQLTRTITTC